MRYTISDYHDIIWTLRDDQTPYVNPDVIPDWADRMLEVVAVINQGRTLIYEDDITYKIVYLWCGLIYEAHYPASDPLYVFSDNEDMHGYYTA